ncbi:hypothetical protein [Streptomyces sp. B22F1]|uniref:hypothetical protein n=1 Tax=Streptomyces sp. B22F1 TaxID=3153566 RepID=UPI00325EFEF5
MLDGQLRTRVLADRNGQLFGVVSAQLVLQRFQQDAHAAADEPGVDGVLFQRGTELLVAWPMTVVALHSGEGPDDGFVRTVWLPDRGRDQITEDVVVVASAEIEHRPANEIAVDCADRASTALQ